MILDIEEVHILHFYQILKISLLFQFEIFDTYGIIII